MINLENLKKYKINLGCGLDKRKGYINIDSDENCKPDILMNIDYDVDFNDNVADEILCYNILEHLNCYDYVIRELHRISKKGACIKIIVPHFVSSDSACDDHNRQFNRFALWKYRDDNIDSTGGFSSTPLFRLKKYKLVYNSGMNFLSDIGKLLPDKFIEDTFLRYVFLPNKIYFEFEVLKST